MFWQRTSTDCKGITIYVFVQYKIQAGQSHAIADICVLIVTLIKQASTLAYFSTCPFGQLTKKSTCPTQSFSCPKKSIKITKIRE